jgi:CheY-like chemotaxis protein
LASEPPFPIETGAGAKRVLSRAPSLLSARRFRSRIEAVLLLIPIVVAAEAQTAGQVEPRAPEPQASFETLRQQAERSEKAAEEMARAFDRYMDVLKTEGEQERKAISDSLESLKTEGEQERKAISDSLESERKILEGGVNLFSSNVSFFGWAAAALVAAYGALFAFVGWRSRMDIEKEVKKQTERDISQAVKSKIAWFQSEFEKLKTQFDGELDKVKRESNQLKQQFDEELDTIKEAVVSDQAQSGRAAAQLVSPVESGQARLSGKRIIWVDDKPNTTLEARDELKNEGATVDAVQSTEELAAKLADKSNKYDLIISDLRRIGNARAGLDYFWKIKDESDLPPRLIVTSSKSVAKYRTEIEELRGNSKGLFLGALAVGEEFFKMVFEELLKPRQAA